MQLRRVVPFALGALLATGISGFYFESRAEREGARLFDQVLSLVQDRFVDSMDANGLFEKAARGLVAELRDPYSELLPPKELKAFTTTTGGRYGGVGMLIEDQQGTIVISRVYPNTPAERAGMLEGDRIIEIEGQSTRGWKTQQVSEKMQGEPGSPVKAKFLRAGTVTPVEVTFTRATIRIPAVPFGIMLDGKIGYVPLQTFNETASREVAAQLSRLRDEGAQGFVLDLRGNSGGFLDQALEVANLFVKEGTPLAAVRSRAEPEASYVAEVPALIPSLPLIILTDGFSASASEIVAGALQDHDRALLVGTTTFGKGLVQTLYRLEDGWALKITTGKWFTPAGRTIHKLREEDGTEIPDTTVAADDVTGRPVFKSTSGRTIYGGGAIRPDIVVRPDTISTAERILAQKLLAKQQEVYVVIYDYALEIKDGIRPDFTVSPAWRTEILRRFRSKGVEVTDAEWNDGVTYVDRVLANRVARLAFGDSTAKRREVIDDNQLGDALERLKRARTQQALFTAAPPPPPSKN
jgi:carboxyl-terminal processing protease